MIPLENTEPFLVTENRGRLVFTLQDKKTGEERVVGSMPQTEDDQQIAEFRRRLLQDPGVMT